MKRVVQFTRFFRCPRDFPVVAPAIAALALIWTLVRPVGDFSLNDDWQYAHVARQFAETGRFHVDVPVAPTLVLQSVAAAGVQKLFGFSHVNLRVLTTAIAVVLLVLLDQLLLLAGVSRTFRAVGLLLLVINPLFVNLSFSFMTEFYGATVGFLGVLLWFRARALEDEGRESAARGVRIVGAMVMGASFWVRQFSVLVFPALIVSRTVLDSRALGWKRAGAGLSRYWLEMIVFVTPVLLYFPWARATGNFNPAFATPLFKLMFRPAIGFWVTQAPVFVFYMTAFFLPVLLWFRLVRRQSPAAAPESGRAGRVLVLILAVSAVLAFLTGDKPYRVGGALHRFFPFLGNTLTPFGVGVITLTDVFRNFHEVLPSFHFWAWICLEMLLIGMAACWIAIGRTFGSGLQRAGASMIRIEIAAFGVALGVLSFITAVQAYLFAVFDRYYFPALIGLMLAVVIAIDGWHRACVRRSMVGEVLGCLAALLMASYSVAGMHDYLRWNEARWGLLEDARRMGIPDREVDGGYELNGWLTFEDGAPNRGDPECGLRQLWFCPGRRYQIAIHAPDGAQTVLRRPIRAWLRNFPDLLLVRKP